MLFIKHKQTRFFFKYQTRLEQPILKPTSSTFAINQYDKIERGITYICV